MPVLLASSLNWFGGLVLFILVIYSLYVLITGKKTKTLNKLIWAILIIILPLIGVILYWVLEKKII